MSALSTIQFIVNHPLNRKRKLSALSGFLKWQLISRLYKRPVIMPFVHESRIIVKKGMPAATGNLYCGLMEFNDMGFLLHLLRPGDVFGDVGANIGSYTILASAVAGARSFSFEPIPGTFSHLKHNIAINNIEQLVTPINAGIGKEESTLTFTNALDDVNHVVPEGSHESGEVIEVPVTTLEKVFLHEKPNLLKIDVEGFEMDVLKGGTSILKDDALKAIIIEVNGCCRQYGVTEDEVHALIRSYGFLPYAYNPMSRELRKIEKAETDNTIYIKDFPFVSDRIKSATKVKVFDVEF